MRKKKITFHQALTMFSLGLDVRHPNYPDIKILELNEHKVRLNRYVRIADNSFSKEVDLSKYHRSLNWILRYE